ncbi:glycosyl hydrolase family 28-related protein [Aquisphaera insulae]|uniref:glycosyl hydrolase family 28-related protein n=1 Tax=Aquisphaera insulae TaxID=2712864 RepID=UPI0013ED48E6|nr:glycosyl hydrolase family 28-related protein [Aquisphaera insulae]
MNGRREHRRDEQGIGRRELIGDLATGSVLGLGLAYPLGAQGAAAADPAIPRTDGILHIKTFGARGDGVSDDTAAIRAAIAAASAAGGGILFFPPGKYVITSTIQVDQGRIAFQGAGWGATIFTPRIVDGDVFAFGDGAHAPDRNKMADFAIRPSQPMKSGAAIHVRNGNGITLTDFEIDGACVGLNIDDLGLQSGVHARDFLIVNASQAAIRIGRESPPPYQPNEVFLTNGTISQCGVGLDLIYVDGLYASALSIYKSATAGVRFGPAEKTVVSDSIFVNCIADSTVSGDGWSFAGSGVTANIALDNCITSFNHGRGLSVQPGARVNGLQVRGGIYQGCDLPGIVLESVQARNVQIQGVQVGFNGKSEIGRHAGIHVGAGVCDFTIDGSMIGEVGTFTSVTRNSQAWGLVIARGSSDGYVITNNRFVGNLTGGLSDGGAGSNKTVAGNITRK